MDEKDMKSIGRKMSVLMGVTLSFFLSLTGMLTSGHFVFFNWLISFLMSTAVSLVIGFIVPMGKIGQAISRKLGKGPNGPSAHIIKSLVSDLIYTPIITFLMVFAAYKNAVAHGAQNLPFIPMFMSSLMVCFTVGFILIFIFEPVFLNILLKKAQSPKADQM